MWKMWQRTSNKGGCGGTEALAHMTVREGFPEEGCLDEEAPIRWRWIESGLVSVFSAEEREMQSSCGKRGRSRL